MGWFDEQIKQRKQRDDDVFQEACMHMADAVIGSKMSAALRSESRAAKDAIDEILKFYNVDSREIPESITDVNEQLEFLLRPYGIMRREAKLEKGWYKDASGAMLGKLKDGGVIALIPTGFTGYSFLDAGTGKRVKVNSKNENLFETEVLCFYKPFPLKKLSIPDLVKYMAQVAAPIDYVMVAAATLGVTLVGMLMTTLNRILYSTVQDSGSMRLLWSLTFCMICVVVSTSMLNAVKSMLTKRINTKLNMSIEAATMMRVMSLPASFFKQYSSGDLASRTAYMNALCNMLVDTVLTTLLTSSFSLIYIVQIFQYTPALVTPAIVIIAVTVVFSIVSGYMQMRVNERRMELGSAQNGMTYAMISGVQKIKLSGAEKRMFSRWAKLYSEVSELTYNPPVLTKLSMVISSAITLVGTIAIYSASVAAHITVADFIAFNTAYSMVSASFMQLAGIALLAAQVQPILNMIKPVMETVPEVSEGKRVLDRISGDIELNHVSFRYTDSMPMVIDDISLRIKPGQYVAIVGTTGCGKSTLLRLILGFEKPVKGSIFFDGKDMESVDLRSLRRRIGTVMQNGGLLSGDIFSNITISAPWLTLDDAWEAAELAGIADDIRRMPMGMFTIISEGQGGISGGQKQRLMIARAIAPKPKVLIFDEATSALDNITQKKVSDALDSLKCTRIVVAHRLSTIRHCDRIIVLDKGKIVEDGTYEQLIENGGFFAELVERQRVDV